MPIEICLVEVKDGLIADHRGRVSEVRGKVGAKVVRHGRYVTFQMAEIAVPRSLFREILRLIDGPRPRPALT